MKIFDLETDNLLKQCTVVHCGWWKDTLTGEWRGYRPYEVAVMWEDLAADNDGLVAHNGLDFDLEVLKKFYGQMAGFKKFYQRCHNEAGTYFLDTLITARVMYPDVGQMDWSMYRRGKLKNFPDTPEVRKKLFGNHNLKAWGYRLGVLKGDFPVEDFGTFTEEMYEYNRQDIVVTEALLNRLEFKAGQLDNLMCIELEHKFALYLQHQMNAGVDFDREKAELLVTHWKRMLAKEITKMRAQIPDIVIEEEFTPKRDNKTMGYKKGEVFTKRKIIPFNPRSADHVIFFLMHKYGWEPTDFTGKKSDKWPMGKPQVTHEVLAALPYPEAPLLARIKVLMDRINLVSSSPSSWIKSIAEDGRIHGYINHNGTPTARCRHSRPNLGNIPSPKALWGKTLRSLFTARSIQPGEERNVKWVLVGCDADGLEMRLLAHYLYPYDNGAFFEMAFNGSKDDGTDAHSLNMKAVNKVLKPYNITIDRECSKTIFYAILYGAWPKRVAYTIIKRMGIDIPKNKQYIYGQIVIDAIKKNIKGLDQLISDLEEQYEAAEARGTWPHLYMPDGRPAPVRSKHSILNTANQTLGSVVMKTATVVFWKLMEEEGLRINVDWFPALHVHDELQVNSKEENVETTRRLAAEAVRRAGEMLRINVPLVGHAQSGPNWSATH